MMRPIVLAALLTAVAATAATGNASFAYRWPQAANRYPALAAWLTADRDRLRASTLREAAADARAARAEGFPFRPHAADMRWSVVTETPRLLSLSATVYTYSGGAHGNSASRALVWDKAVQRRIDPIAPFTSAAALEAAIRPAWCARLTAERRQRRGGDVRGFFTDCPPLKDLALLLGSTDRTRIDRMGLIADAYVAGPYAEGPYEITLPVTRAVLNAVKPAWRPAFAISR